MLGIDNGDAWQRIRSENVLFLIEGRMEEAEALAIHSCICNVLDPSLSESLEDNFGVLVPFIRAHPHL